MTCSSSAPSLEASHASSAVCPWLIICIILINNRHHCNVENGHENQWNKDKQMIDKSTWLLTINVHMMPQYMSIEPDDEVNMMTIHTCLQTIWRRLWSYLWAKTRYDDEVNMMTMHQLLPMWSCMYRHIWWHNCTYATGEWESDIWIWLPNDDHTHLSTDNVKKVVPHVVGQVSHQGCLHVGKRNLLQKVKV